MGGTSSTSGDRLQIQGANAVTFIVTAATSYANYNDFSADPAAACGLLSLAQMARITRRCVAVMRMTSGN